jgi:vacuolar-type H+-ATPase subunit E/Vma4
MKRYDPSRADARPIEEKAYGLIFAMTDKEAARLRQMLLDEAAAKSRRANFILTGKAMRHDHPTD